MEIFYSHTQNFKFLQLSALFRSVVKGNNFITPRLIGYCEISNGVIEITTGSKFLETEMYGLTIVENGQKSDKSCCVNSVNEVYEFLKNYK